MTNFGFQARNTPAERRAFFDLIRKNAAEGAVIDEMLDAIADLEAATTPTTWTAVTFQNSWQNWGVGSFRGVQYSSLGDEVRIRGLASRPAGDSTATIFTLPTGMRPLIAEIFICQTAGGDNRVDVEVNGDVHVTAGAGNGGYLSLANIRFSVTN